MKGQVIVRDREAIIHKSLLIFKFGYFSRSTACGSTVAAKTGFGDMAEDKKGLWSTLLSPSRRDRSKVL